MLLLDGYMYADSGICSSSLTSVRFIHRYWRLLLSAIIVTATCSVDLDVIDSRNVIL
jgi:hypothetical protein